MDKGKVWLKGKHDVMTSLTGLTARHNHTANMSHGWSGRLLRRDTKRSALVHARDDKHGVTAFIQTYPNLKKKVQHARIALLKGGGIFKNSYSG